MNRQSTKYFQNKKLIARSRVDDYYPIKPLGKGAYGSVCLVKSYKDNKKYAMKIIRGNFK